MHSSTLEKVKGQRERASNEFCPIEESGNHVVRSVLKGESDMTVFVPMQRYPPSTGSNTNGRGTEIINSRIPETELCSMRVGDVQLCTNRPPCLSSARRRGSTPSL